MIIFKSPKVSVEFDSTVPSVVWTPIEFISGDEWRTPFNKGVDFLSEQIKKTPNMGWLNDTRKLKSVGIDDLNWLNKNVNDRCFQYGLKKVAFVLPENTFGRMAVKFYVQLTNSRSDNKFQIKAFRTYPEAVSWIKAGSTVSANEVSL